MSKSLNWQAVDFLIEKALAEDFGEMGDVTTRGTISDSRTGKAELIAKESGVIAGLPVFCRVFKKIDSRINCLLSVDDGERVSSGAFLGSIEGTIRSILKGERTALNFLQHLSGIATVTSEYVARVKGSGTKILDTRKTTPLFRMLEKYAVRKGGGENHRFGLYDMVMIKDNHIDSAGGITPAVNCCIAYLREKKLDMKIEVETRNLSEVEEALKLPIDRIMLDNMRIEVMQKAVRLINGKKEVEASGNITLKNIQKVASTGVDFISIGALTHSVQALDISLRIQ